MQSVIAGAGPSEQRRGLFWIIILLVVLSGCTGKSLWNIMPTGRLRAMDLEESSGLVASRQYEDVFWTHNDSGHSPYLYAIDEEGETLRRVIVEGAENHDWEDIAIDAENNLYILDNTSLRRPDQQTVVYRLPEPDPYDDEPVSVQQTFSFKFSGGPHDCEALFVRSPYLYMVSKSWEGTLPRIFRYDTTRSEGVADLMGTVPVYTMVTGGDISPDGKQIILSSYRALLYFESGTLSPEKLLQEPPVISRLNARQIEAVAFEGENVFLTNEQRDVFQVKLEDIKASRAPFVQTPKQEVPYTPSTPTVQQSLSSWLNGEWLESDVPDNSQIAKVVWSPAGVHLGIELPEGYLLTETGDTFGREDFEDWFEPGRIFLLVNPDGSRPLSYGENDRCVVVGADASGEARAAAHYLKPATLIGSSEVQPGWLKVEREGSRFLLTIRQNAPGFGHLAEGRELGFNLIIIAADGEMISWAPLTRRFTWDNPSVWGLLELED